MVDNAQIEEGQTEEGQVEEGQTEEGQVEEGQTEEGQVEEGQTEEGQVEEGQTEEGQIEEAPITRKKITVDEATLKEREARIRAEAQLEILSRQTPIQQHTDTARLDAERAERERLSLMTAEEQERYKLSKTVNELQNQVKHTQLLAQFNQADNADRTSFMAKATDKNNPQSALYSRHAVTVEQKLNEYRKSGVYPTREEVLKLVIGEAILAAKPNVKARQAAKTRVASTQGKSVSISNNSGPSSKKDAKDCTLQELRDRIQNANKR